ncbi:MAG: TolC family protein [Verrucomicrobiales bacterium]|nr:TolC family protein [Verrucomicrobiales bacterium]
MLTTFFKYIDLPTRRTLIVTATLTVLIGMHVSIGQVQAEPNSVIKQANSSKTGSNLDSETDQASSSSSEEDKPITSKEQALANNHASKKGSGFFKGLFSSRKTSSKPPKSVPASTAQQTKTEATPTPVREPAESKSSENPEKKGWLGRLLSRKNKKAAVVITAPVEMKSDLASRYPALDTKDYRKTKQEKAVENLVAQIYASFDARVNDITAADLRLPGVKKLPPVPQEIEATWFRGIQDEFWPDQQRMGQRLEDIYARALINSNQVDVFSYNPLIRETSYDEARGQYDLELFADGTVTRTDEPTGSTLTTGQTGRFIQDLKEAEAGVRKMLSTTGAKVSLSNRLSSLKNNSQFTDPNAQTASQIVFSITQPLLRGGGYAYNHASLKVAQLDSRMAAAEYIRSLENHLLEVNQAYWGIYLARSAFMLRRELVKETAEITEKIEKRPGEVTASDLLRAQAELSERRTSLIRSEMAVRNAEERLRALVNDPNFPIGGKGELIPLTRPVLSPPKEKVQQSARMAIDNRVEIAQSFDRVRAAGIRRDFSKNELLPQLNLIGEASNSGLDAGSRNIQGAYTDLGHQSPGWIAGLRFSQPLGNHTAEARNRRNEYELRKEIATLRSTLDAVLLESVVTYRELLTAYRDMQGRHLTLKATREEVRSLKERLVIDANNGQTISFRLQILLDALQRNQQAEERFLVSVVTYNIAFAALEKAKGTFLTYQDVNISRVKQGKISTFGKPLESLRATIPSLQPNKKSSVSDKKVSK